jgi:hypothetical protein
MVMLAKTPDFPHVVHWFIDGQLILKESAIFVVPPDASGRTLSIEIRPIIPSFPHVEFSSAISSFPVLQHPDPQVLSIEIDPEPEEDLPLSFRYVIFPPNVNLTKTIDAAPDLCSPFETITIIDSNVQSFTPSRDHIGKFLRLCIATESRKYCAYCLRPVTKGPLKVRRAKIAGAFEVGHPHVVILELNDSVDFCAEY